MPLIPESGTKQSSSSRKLTLPFSSDAEQWTRTNAKHALAKRERVWWLILSAENALGLSRKLFGAALLATRVDVHE